MKKMYLTKAIVCLFTSIMLLIDGLVFQVEKSGKIWMLIACAIMFIFSIAHFKEFLFYKKKSKHRKIEDCRIV